MSLLSKKIDEHLKQNFTGFHSPAHCGKLNPRDLTELDGLDDLQYPQEVLRESQEFVASLFGAQSSYFLINGASVGMQAACLALKVQLNSINDSRPVLVARNVHKSTIAGIILAGLKVEWLEPIWDENLGIYTVVARNAVTKESSPKNSALIITNPTYEGFYSEIPQLDIPLIVDEAHGTHFHFSDQLPKPGLEYGADIVVQSWHKTLGSLTQTGVIHRGKNSKIKGEYLADSLRLLQSTSPSYLLLESLSKTAELYAQEGKEIIAKTIELSKKIISPLRVENHDPLKLVLHCPGNKLEEFLTSKNILIEAAGQNYALAFINAFNREEDIFKLQKALDQFSYDQDLSKIPSPVFSQQSIEPREAFFKGDTEIYAPCPPGIALRVPGQTPQYLQNLDKHEFHKLIIGASLKDFKTIEHYAYLFTHAGADAIDISAFPHSVISAQNGIKKATTENPNLIEPLIMVSVNIAQDPHFRRIELNATNCTECLACIPSCPSDAFYVEENNFRYNIDLCFGCSACIPVCHFDALSFINWSEFDFKSLNELVILGANAIEIHLNNDLKDFSKFYRSMPNSFSLESFCIGSEQMTEADLINATHKIIDESALKHGSKRKLIIQTDGIPLSGARLEHNCDKDLISINNAKIVLETIEKFYPDRKNIFVQLAGGITENSFAKALKQNVKIHGIAIGSYARKKLSSVSNIEDQVQTAKKLLQLSKNNLKNSGNLGKRSLNLLQQY